MLSCTVSNTIGSSLSHPVTILDRVAINAAPAVSVEPSVPVENADVPMYYTDIKKLTYNHTLSLSVYLVFMYEIELCRSGPNWYDCQTSFFNFYVKGRRDAKEQCVAVLTRNVEVLGSGPIKGHRCFLEQET